MEKRENKIKQLRDSIELINERLEILEKTKPQITIEDMINDLINFNLIQGE